MHKELSADLEKKLLFECICKYKKRLDKDNRRHHDSYQRDSSPKRILQSYSSLVYIAPSTEYNVRYKKLQDGINLSKNYQYLDLDIHQMIGSKGNNTSRT